MTARNVYSVGQVNNYIRHMFSEDFLLRSILVRGEVSNCKYHSSGHIYFTLKDASGTLSAVMFAGRVARGLSFRMKEGDQVIVAGTVDVYTKTGSYQLYAERIIRDGVGLLNEKYELLKKKLEEMGMFSEEYKQKIPRYIRTLGVVTAPTGAAVRDIINIAKRRNPYVQIILYPAIVQGEEAKDSIIRGIRMLDGKVDTIIIGRGGGSLEDLWAFNEEEVAEAVFECRTPIISAVGHETDTVITDYVADLRAPTPSAAAELAVFEVSKYDETLRSAANDLTQKMLLKIGRSRERVLSFQRQVQARSPQSLVREQRVTAARYQDRLLAAMEGKIRDSRRSADLSDRFTRDMQQVLTAKKQELSLYAARLDQSSPLKRLSGGYGFVTGEDGKAVLDVGSVAKGDLLSIRMKNGKIEAAAERVIKEEK